jgi:hypothetical protein
LPLSSILAGLRTRKTSFGYFSSITRSANRSANSLETKGCPLIQEDHA